MEKPVNKPEDSNENKVNIEQTVAVTPNMVAEKRKKKPSNLPPDVQKNKSRAWLAYILFFIPLLIDAQSPFMRHHANEGLEINIFDALGIVLLLLGTLITSTNVWIAPLLIIFTILGLILLVLTTITKIYMIISTLHGKAVTTPWMWNLRIIK